MIVDELRKSILDYAIHGRLSNQNISDSDANNLIPEKSQLKDNYKKFNLTINEDEYPFQIPSNWIWVKLGMLFDYQNGYPYKPIETIKNGKGYPIIKSQNIMKRIVEINSKTSFVENPSSKMLKSKINKGDFLMCLSSQSNNPEPLGKTAIYGEEKFALLNQRVLKLTPINCNLSKYLYYVINSFYFHNTVSHKGGGSAQSNLKLEHVMEMYIPLPPIEEQQRIVDKLEELFAKLDEIKPIEEELNKLKTDLPLEMNKSIIDYVIHGRLSNQNISDSDANNLIPEKSQLKDNYKKFNLTINEDEYPFQIPSNWIWVKLGMLFDYQNGYSYKPSETLKNGKGYPVIKSQNIMKRIVEINSQTSFVEIPTDKMLKSKVNKGDFLMCLSSQSNNPEPLGKTAIYENEDFALLNQRVLKLTPINYDLSKYLYYVINSFYFHKTVSHKGGGSAQSNLKLEHVMEMYIPLPPIEEQKRIVDRLEQLLPLCDDIEKIINAKAQS